MKFKVIREAFMECPNCETWFSIEESYKCPRCKKEYVQVLVSDDDISCPECGWEAQDGDRYLIKHSKGSQNMMGGMKDYDWTETWYCPECNIIFELENSNY